jgi:Carboxypeptidase regulatory-like domain
VSRIRAGGLFLVLVGWLVQPALAQQLESRVTGKIVDQGDLVMPGVTVTVTSRDNAATRATETRPDGTFTVTNLAPGSYEVKAEMPGFTTKSQLVTLALGQTENVTLQLTVAVQESVTVTAQAPVLDTTSAKIGVNVSPEEVQNLPVNGRNFANLMTLATGATSDGNGGWASIRFNGKSNQQNYLNYDGVDGTYVWDASPGYLNATGSQFRLQTSMESVAEFRVNSGLAPAESGLGAGGNITVVSKSGGNRYSGSVFEYRRDDALDSKSPYDNIKLPLSLDQYGVSLGGPIARNKTFFFLSYERLSQETGLRFTEAVPSALARSNILNGIPTTSGGGRSPSRTMAVAPLLNGFPIGTQTTSNKFLELATNTSTAKQTENAFALRLDHRLNDSNSFYSGTSSATATSTRRTAPRRPAG